MGENSFVADVNFKLHFLLDATIFKQLMMRKKGKKSILPVFLTGFSKISEENHGNS